MENYKYCKTDHDSDCAVYNAPALPKENCNCGLIPDMPKAMRDYISITSPHTHDGETDNIASAFQAGYNFKSAIGNDTEFLLSEFKETEQQNFDKFGKKYPATPVSADTAELMRHLIFKLEEHIRQVDNNDYAF